MSYYDAVGLLAICDAIETVEAASSSSNSSASPSPPPSGLASHKSLKSAYSHISHIHSLGHSHHHAHSHHHSHSHHPRGATAKIAAMDHHHHHHQNHNYHPSGSGSGSNTHHISAGDLSALDGGDIPGAMTPAIDPAFLDPVEATADSAASSRAASESVKSEYTTTSSLLIPLGQTYTPQPPRSGSSSWTTKRSKSVSSAHGKPPQPSISPVTVPPELRSEECHICGRVFRGPKSSTHKQQHIRRLHPDDYQPKRGGKKRVALGGNSTPGYDIDDQSPSDSSPVMPSGGQERRVRTKREVTIPVTLPVAALTQTEVISGQDGRDNQPSESNGPSTFL
ncbi:hypothetical protein V1512DRAFT_268181 [Lipomyces arxii]|uniref:uncharacterized protein n=1 Tax=Lipomyces arxii TaxID=56418 RepID=UPI0034CEB1FC